MKLIEYIYIDRFRSFRKEIIDNLSSFAIISGKNNSGKSNILRALSLFFTDEIEPGIALDMQRDGCAGKGEKKRIQVEVKFSLDKNLNIQKTIRNALQNIPRNSRIKKEYEVDLSSPKGYKVRYFVNSKELSGEDKKNVDIFLSLFNFRYVTANRTPSAVLEENLLELRSELKYKYNWVEKRRKKKGAETSILDDLRSLAQKFFEPVGREIQKADKNILDVNVSMPEGIADLINTSVYQIKTISGRVLSERLQGHGVQNLLLFSVLHLIDRNFHRKFGWKIATIWAVEEPETFLHFDLENQLASYFENITGLKNRFQILCTTHSNVFPQYASSCHLINMEVGKKGKDFYWSKCRSLKTHEFLRAQSVAKISSCPALLTTYPHKKILLTEGEIDEKIIGWILERSGIRDVVVFSIKKFVSDEQLKGEEFLREFVMSNMPLLSNRAPRCGIYIIFDWDCEKSKINPLKKRVKPPNQIWQFEISSSNQLLDKSFKGIEKFYPIDVVLEMLEKTKALIIDRGEDYSKNRYYLDKGRVELVKKGLFEVMEQKKDSFSLEHFQDLIELLKST